MPLRSRIPLIVSELDDKMLEGITEFANAIALDAQERVPVLSGALRDAIHVEAEDGEVRVVAGDTDAFYGHIVEFGSVNTPPHPFLIPALEALRLNIEAIIGEKLKGL